jgi:hypothetical protein
MKRQDIQDEDVAKTFVSESAITELLAVRLVKTAPMPDIIQNLHPMAVKHYEKLSMLVWVVTPCGLVNIYQRF